MILSHRKLFYIKKFSFSCVSVLLFWFIFVPSDEDKQQKTETKQSNLLIYRCSYIRLANVRNNELG